MRCPLAWDVGKSKTLVSTLWAFLIGKGLCVGSSSCVNLCAAVHIARQLGPGHRIVTFLCDSGARHLSKFYNDKWLTEQGIEVLDRYDDLSFLDHAQDAQ